MSFSLASLAKSRSSALMAIWLPLMWRRTWWVVLLAKMATRRIELRKVWRSMVSLFGFVFGITAS